MKNKKITLFLLFVSAAIGLTSITYFYTQNKKKNEEIASARSIIQNHFNENSKVILTELLNSSTKPEVGEITIAVFSALENYPLKFSNLNSIVIEDLRRGRNFLQVDKEYASYEKLRKIDSYFSEAIKSYSNSKNMVLPEEDVSDQLNKAYNLLKIVLRSSEIDSESRSYTLYVLGDIGLQLWAENKDMEGALFIIELIRSQPETELAKMAWIKMNDQIHFGYSGSAGDSTPAEWLTFLDELRVIAYEGFPENFSISKANKLNKSDMVAIK